MNEIPKIVFSKTMKKADWAHARIDDGDLSAAIARLRQEPGKDILAHGGAAFAQALTRLDLIDEFRLIIHPIVLSGGLALFSEARDLRLVNTKTFPAGAVALTYHRA